MKSLRQSSQLGSWGKRSGIRRSYFRTESIFLFFYLGQLGC
jgi:hypothetical protein